MRNARGEADRAWRLAPDARARRDALLVQWACEALSALAATAELKLPAGLRWGLVREGVWSIDEAIAALAAASPLARPEPGYAHPNMSGWYVLLWASDATSLSRVIAAFDAVAPRDPAASIEACVVESLADEGRIDEAFARLGRVDWPGSRIKALERLLPRLDPARAALAISDAWGYLLAEPRLDFHYRADELLTLLSFDRSPAREGRTLALAERIAALSPDELGGYPDHGDLRAGLAVAFAHVGALDDALGWARRYCDEGGHPWEFSGGALVRLGEVAGALPEPHRTRLGLEALARQRAHVRAEGYGDPDRLAELAALSPELAAACADVVAEMTPGESRARLRVALARLAPSLAPSALADLAALVPTNDREVAENALAYAAAFEGAEGVVASLCDTLLADFDPNNAPDLAEYAPAGHIKALVDALGSADDAPLDYRARRALSRALATLAGRDDVRADAASAARVHALRGRHTHIDLSYVRAIKELRKDLRRRALVDGLQAERRRARLPRELAVRPDDTDPPASGDAAAGADVERDGRPRALDVALARALLGPDILPALAALDREIERPEEPRPAD